MENKDIIGDQASDLFLGKKASHSQETKEAGLSALRRDNDSLDDFEHLEHDVSPVKEVFAGGMPAVTKADNDSAVPSSDYSPPRAVSQVINTTLASAGETAAKFADNLQESSSVSATQDFLFDSDSNKTAMSYASDLLDMGTTDKPSSAVTDLLGDFSYAPPIPPHSAAEKPAGEKAFAGDFDNFKSATQSFMDLERTGDVLFQPAAAKPDIVDRFSDSEPEIDDFKPSSNEDFKYTSKVEEMKIDDFLSKSPEHSKTDMFKDVIDEPEPDSEPELEPELPKRDYFDKEPSPIKEVPIFKPEPPKISEMIKTVPEPKPITPTAPIESVIQPKPVEKIQSLTKKAQEVIAAEAMFCKMGLDAWFNPERLNPKVESLIYWRDPRKSGAVFGGTLVVLLSLAYFSLISVAAYLSLLALAGTISFRIYKNVLQAVQKTADGHPFKEFLDADIALPQEKVREITDIAVTHLNAAGTELRRLFLVEDLVDSIKFGVLLWCLTYLGAWFNGMTIIIIAFVALFTLPKVYENNKTQIDANLDIVRTKLAEITSKVKAAIPIGKKSEEKKEQ